MSLLLLGAVSGCTFYNVRTIEDDFDGFTINRIWGNDLAGGYGVDLNVQRFVSKEGQVKYSLIVNYDGNEWLFIEDGESLVLLVDGERMGFSGGGSQSHRSTLTGGSVYESAFYDATPDQVRKIAGATRQVRAKVIGNQYFIERWFSQGNVDNFKKFVAEYVDSEAADSEAADSTDQPNATTAISK